MLVIHNPELLSRTKDIRIQNHSIEEVDQYLLQTIEDRVDDVVYYMVRSQICEAIEGEQGASP